MVNGNSNSPNTSNNGINNNNNEKRKERIWVNVCKNGLINQQTN